MNVRPALAQSDLDRLVDAIAPIKTGFDLLDDHVIITDADAHILYANKAVARNTGFSNEETLGKNPADLWGGQMPQEFYERMWRTIKTEKQPFVAEVHNRKKDGTSYWQELHLSPILDERGDVRFFIGVEPNITNRKAKEKFRDEFVSILGHQLQSPLVTVKWIIEFLLKDTTLTREQREKVVATNAANESMIGLVASLLALVKLGDTELKSEEFDLAQGIETVVERVRIKNPRVFISFRHEGGDLLVGVNKPLALEVFTNLIANAAEYSDKEAGAVSLVLKKDETGILFSSKNNGAGIPPEDQPRIFSKLFRASNAAEAKAEGSGLGLFIVKLICDKFGWEVSFKSPVTKDGRGAIFFVKMPPPS